ncbi:PREDICTED: superoxide dismutase [Mn], mitochondrial-like [Nelumbo nucifera]|uniref:superoxide dismutase n=1 Tax=Nelumbo nucifera TaxID=4432 RepID=A0A1U8Q1V5_NELNU|nr:PREDICTED: superoxide dismutase [Mn], mitochondrial-like [Nelumbo nucifera]
MALRTLISRRTVALGLGFQNAESRILGLGFRRAPELQTFFLLDLPYDYGALEPAISAEIMKLHHQKQHQTYIINYNKALEQHEGEMGAIKFNGGGRTYYFSFLEKYEQKK